MIEIRRDERLARHAQDAFQLVGRGMLDRLIDLLDRGLAAGMNFRSTSDTFGVGTRMAVRRACPSAPAARGPRRRRTRRGRDHIEASRARPARILVRLVEDVLVIGVGMDRGHEARLDPAQVVQDLGNRSKAVRGARGVRDNRVLTLQLSWLTPVDDRQVGALRRRRDEHPAWRPTRDGPPPSRDR